MEATISPNGHVPERTSAMPDLETHKDVLAAAIRRYRSVRRFARRDGGRGIVAAAEEDLIEAWRAVIELEGHLAGYSPLQQNQS